MEYFQVRYNSRAIIYERKMFIRLATGADPIKILQRKFCCNPLFFLHFDWLLKFFDQSECLP